MTAKAKRAETIAQLQRQIDSLMRLCGEQLRKIQKLEKERERLLRTLTKAQAAAGVVEDEGDRGV